MIADPPEGICDCGAPLEGHPDLPPVQPLRSWMAERGDSRETIMRRAAAAANLSNRVEPRARPRSVLGNGLTRWW